MAISPASAERDAPAVDLAVLAKAPVAGLAKTRLIPALGAAGAARLHRQLLKRTLAVAAQSGLRVQLWCAPDAAHPFFQIAARRLGLRCHVQPEGDIGQRMQAVFAAQPAGRPLLLVGSDCPVFTAAHLQDAAQRLQSGDEAVFTPAEDGGYVLVGLRRPQPVLFEGLAWSTSSVMAQTRQRLADLGLRHSEMPTLWDIDRPEDLARLSSAGLGRIPWR